MNFIENIVGFFPDGGNGSLETLLLVAPLVLISGFAIRRLALSRLRNRSI
jgi:hypothetical protein